MTRQLTCQRRTATGSTEHLPNLWCSGYGSIKPSITQDCNADSPCERKYKHDNIIITLYIKNILPAKNTTGLVYRLCELEQVRFY